MGVYIKNMEKPKSCAKCKLVTQFVMGELFCDVLDKQVSPYVIPHDCPLIEIDLVRCKDCKHSKNCVYPAKWNWCPDGERRTDD